MKQAGQQLKWIMAAFAGALVLTLLTGPETSRTDFEAEQLRRSRAFVKTFGAERLPDLELESRLVLMTAYARLGRSAEVIRVGEYSLQDIRSMPLKQKQTFLGMLERAYRDLGEYGKAIRISDQW